jgi:adenine-specific DNA-methyltransferase
VKRWTPRWDKLYAIVFPFGFHEQLENYPAILKHLTQFEADLRKRGQCVSSRGGSKTGQHHWLELDNNPKPSYLQEFTQPKVIIPAIERSCAFAFDDEGYYSNDKTTICVSDDARFLCGVLNSSVTWWIIRQIAAERQNDFRSSLTAFAAPRVGA